MDQFLTEIGLGHYLAVSTLVFSFGCAIILMRRNLVAVLMGVELIMNAAALNFVAFDRFVKQGTDGQMVAIFLIVAAAAEAAVALALVLNFFNRFNSINVDQGADLKL